MAAAIDYRAAGRNRAVTKLPRNDVFQRVKHISQLFGRKCQMKSHGMTIPCKSVLQIKWIGEVRPEGLDVERRQVLFPCQTRPHRRVFFCAHATCMLS
jgi:hypothetical protein